MKHWCRFESSVWQGMYLPESASGADSLTVDIQPLCSTACINICVHVKNPKCWQSYHWMHENNYNNNNKEEFVQHPSTVQGGSTGHLTVTLAHTHTQTHTYVRMHTCSHTQTHVRQHSCEKDSLERDTEIPHTLTWMVALLLQLIWLPGMPTPISLKGQWSTKKIYKNLHTTQKRTKCNPSTWEAAFIHINKYWLQPSSNCITWQSSSMKHHSGESDHLRIPQADLMWWMIKVPHTQTQSDWLHKSHGGLVASLLTWVRVHFNIHKISIQHILGSIKIADILGGGGGGKSVKTTGDITCDDIHPIKAVVKFKGNLT